MLLFLLLLLFIFCKDEIIVSKEKVEFLNGIPNKSWTAWLNPSYEGKTIEFFEKFFHPITIRKESSVKRKRLHVVKEKKIENDLPKEYDFLSSFPNCSRPLRIPGKCGSMGALSGTDVLSDRFCQASNGKINVVLSAEAILSCVIGPGACYTGCAGQWDWCYEFDYMEEHGVVTSKCLPYTSGKAGITGNCPNKCVKSSGLDWEKDKYYGKGNTTEKYWEIDVAMKKLIEFGSFQSQMMCYEDLFTYKKGVYVHKTGKYLGGAYVKVNGWGVDSVSGLSYWKIATYFGEDFGMKGYLLIEKGTNECGIEEIMMGILPKMS